MNSNTSSSDSNAGSANNVRHRGRPRKTVGRKRRGKSLGRYPFLAAAKRYLERRIGLISEGTVKQLERRYRLFQRVFDRLKKEGKVSTTDPSILAREDIQAYVKWMQNESLDQRTQAQYMSALSQLCLSCGNTVLQRIRDEGERLPTATPKDIVSLEESDLKTLRTAAGGMEGWNGDVVGFLVSFYPYTGLRPSELRLANIEDLDVKSWTLYVAHPKGEGKYAKKRTVVILPPAREPTLVFLAKRRKRLEENGLAVFVESGPLVPSIREGGVKHYSASAFRVMKHRLEDVTGLSFRLKDFRPTFTQMTLDKDPTLLSDVSKQLGHATSRTTELHYGRIRDRTAFRRLEEAWTEHAGLKPDTKSDLIETKEYIPGYA
jgi:integrase